MKKLYPTLLFTTLSWAAFSQFTETELNFNEVDAHLSNGGVFFNQPDGASGYEVPAASGNHLINALSFWFGGEDINGQLKLSAQTYDRGSDFSNGALKPGTAEPGAEPQLGDVYSVAKADIDNHIANWDEPGYSVPESLEDWPAHGDVAEGFAFNMAPFEDVDGDGVYIPENGDYPLIKGDYATYMILNDMVDSDAGIGDPIGLEMHFLFYQFESDDAMDQTTFINMRLINRSTQTLYGFKVGCFIDPDLGYYMDDFIGYNEDYSMMYAYNGDNFDEGGYGENPPAFGVMALNHSAEKFVAFSNVPGPTSMPETASEYYGYMNGNWKNGVAFTHGGNGYGGEEPTDYLYPGIPYEEDGWTEMSEENVPGDRKMMMSTDGGVLFPGSQLCLDYAVVYSRETDHIGSLESLVDVAGEAQTFYYGWDLNYCDFMLSVPEHDKDENLLEVFPNPSSGTFTVNAEGTYGLEIYALDGRRVFNQTENFGSQVISTNLVSGNYLVVLTQNEKQYHSKITIQH